MALKRRCPDIGLLHHSDQGCRHSTIDYVSPAVFEQRALLANLSER